MSPDQQEAESRKYSNEAVMMLLLSSGRVAVYNRAFQLDWIIDEKQLTDELPGLVETIKAVKPPSKPSPILTPVKVPLFISSNFDLDI